MTTDNPTTRLGVWMRSAGLDDQAVAERCAGVSRSQISRVRRGVSRASLDLAEKLEALTGIPALDIMRGAVAAGVADETSEVAA